MDYSGTAKLSSGLEIQNANSKFFRMIGATTYISAITKIVHADDVDRFNEIADNLRDGNEKRFVFRMLSGGEYKSFYAKLQKRDDGSECFDIEIFDIDEMSFNLEDYSDTIAKYRTILASEKDVYFEYNLHTKKIKLFKITSNRDVLKAETELSQWEEELIRGNVISEDSIHAFNRLCSNLENGRNVHSVFEIGEDNNEVLIISGKTVSKNGQKACVCGTLTYRDKDHLNDLTDKSGDSFDELTGLYRKNAIKKLAEEKLNSGTDDLVSLVILDIDDFKHINDNYGHLFGDEVIASVADIIKEAVGDLGIVGRFGGDEFYILVDRAADKDELRSILRCIKTNIGAKRWKNQPSATTSCSIGSATYPVNGKDYDTIFKKADKALYIAKEKGKNRYVIYEEAIHGELKKEQTADKFGIITNLGTGSSESAMFMNHITTELMSKGKVAIPDIMDELQKRYFLDRINIYYGENFDKVYQLGKYKRSEAKSYIDENYVKLFDDSNILVMNFTYKLEATHEAAYKRLSNESVYSAVQCLLGSKQDVRGLCSFEQTNYKKMFAHDEVMVYSVFSNLVGILLSAT